MARLIVMRHAKSDWDAAARDHDRPLNRRGERAARTMGELLTRIGEVPDHALVSSARRARSTYDLAAAAGGWSTEADVVDELYGTDVGGALDVVRRHPGNRPLLLVGHEPTWSSLVQRLTGGRVAMKTATTVAIDLPHDGWSTIGHGDGTIAWVLQPRSFTAADHRG